MNKETKIGCCCLLEIMSFCWNKTNVSSQVTTPNFWYFHCFSPLLTVVFVCRLFNILNHVGVFSRLFLNFLHTKQFKMSSGYLCCLCCGDDVLILIFLSESEGEFSASVVGCRSRDQHDYAPPANCLHISNNFCCSASRHLLRLSKCLAGSKISNCYSVSLHLFDNTRNYSFLPVCFPEWDFSILAGCGQSRVAALCLLCLHGRKNLSHLVLNLLHLWTFIDLLTNVQLTFYL